MISIRVLANKIQPIKTRPTIQNIRTLMQIQNRPHLPGSENPNFPKYLAEFRDDFPHRFNVPDIKKKDLVTYTKELRPTLRNLIQEHGAVLIKGMPLSSGGDFAKFFAALDLDPVEYLGGTGVRQKVAKNVSTASNEPPEFNIEPHNEMAYLSNWPHLFIMFCETPAGPGCGGESGITDVRKVFKNLDSGIKADFIERGLRYHFCLMDQSKTDYTSWQDAFMTDSRKEAEKVLKDADQPFEWGDDGRLTYWINKPAMRPHYRTGEKLWFNQAHCSHWTFFDAHPTIGRRHRGQSEMLYPHTILYGDGSVMKYEVIQHIREVIWNCTVGGQLQKSDVLVLDNMYMQHSRLSFSGERRLLITLAKYKDL